MSERFTSTVPDELADKIPFHEFESKSGAIVHHVERGLEVDETEEELKELRTERDNLRRQLQAANTRMDDVQEFVEYVEEERSLQTRREERRDAPSGCGPSGGCSAGIATTTRREIRALSRSLHTVQHHRFLTLKNPRAE